MICVYTPSNRTYIPRPIYNKSVVAMYIHLAIGHIYQGSYTTTNLTYIHTKPRICTSRTQQRQKFLQQQQNHVIKGAEYIQRVNAYFHINSNELLVRKGISLRVDAKSVLLPLLLCLNALILLEPSFLYACSINCLDVCFVAITYIILFLQCFLKNLPALLPHFPLNF